MSCLTPEPTIPIILREILAGECQTTGNRVTMKAGVLLVPGVDGMIHQPVGPSLHVVS